MSLFRFTYKLSPQSQNSRNCSGIPDVPLFTLVDLLLFLRAKTQNMR